MADFMAKIHALRIEPHPNADRLELAAIGGYRSVVLKGQFKDGDLAAYIPEGAVCPDWVIADLGLEGRLAGSKKNRVKAVRLRGVLSQGLVYPLDDGGIRGRPVAEGDVVTELLGLEKYAPPVPINMQGAVTPAFGKTLKYDIEDVKRFPDVLAEGEPVHMTEKIHGTWCCLGWHPGFGPIVTSKGMAAKGLVMQIDAEENENNLYVMAWRAHREKLLDLFSTESDAEPWYVLGEIHGPGVQDLHYGRSEPGLRIFDCYIGHPGRGSYVPAAKLYDGGLATLFDLVPPIWEGPFSEEAMLGQTDGRSTLGDHVREGVVIKPLEERRHPELGRVILKSVSGDYLTRNRKRGA